MYVFATFLFFVLLFNYITLWMIRAPEPSLLNANLFIWPMIALCGLGIWCLFHAIDALS